MNRRLTWTLAFLCCSYSVSLLAVSADCDCTRYPFRPDPPCYKQCTSAILKSSSKAKLERVLGLSPALAEKISARQASAQPIAFDNLTTAEQREVNESFKNLSQAKVDTLRTTDR